MGKKKIPFDLDYLFTNEIPSIYLNGNDNKLLNYLKSEIIHNLSTKALMVYKLIECGHIDHASELAYLLYQTLNDSLLPLFKENQEIKEIKEKRKLKEIK